jgi:hypothetical protein
MGNGVTFTTPQNRPILCPAGWTGNKNAYCATDTGGPLGHAIVVIIGAIAELERNLIIERVRVGIRRARLEGQHIGRNPLVLDPCRDRTRPPAWPKPSPDRQRPQYLDSHRPACTQRAPASTSRENRLIGPLFAMCEKGLLSPPRKSNQWPYWSIQMCEKVWILAHTFSNTQT